MVDIGRSSCRRSSSDAPGKEHPVHPRRPLAQFSTLVPVGRTAPGGYCVDRRAASEIRGLQHASSMRSTTLVLSGCRPEAGGDPPPNAADAITAEPGRADTAGTEAAARSEGKQFRGHDYQSARSARVPPRTQ